MDEGATQGNSRARVGGLQSTWTVRRRAQAQARARPWRYSLEAYWVEYRLADTKVMTTVSLTQVKLAMHERTAEQEELYQAHERKIAVVRGDIGGGIGL